MDAAAGKSYFKLQANARASDPRTVGLVVHEFMLRSASTSMMLGRKDRYMIHQSWVAAPYPPSFVPLGTLEKLYIEDLQLETHHRGFYSLLRFATPPVTMTAVMTVMEDEKDDGVVFQLLYVSRPPLNHI